MANRTEPVEGYKLEICKKIDNYLNETGMSNKDFGAIFGVSEGNVRRWRNCIGSLDINQLVILAKFWKVSIDELIGLDSINSLSSLELERLRKLRENPTLADLVDNYSRK